MAAHPPSPARPRARPGSLERPVNGRLYRGTWMLVGIPLLIAAFSVAKPQALRPAEPALPPSFDRARAVGLAAELSRLYPDRSPGSEGAAGARRWFASAVGAYGVAVRSERFSAELPGRGRKQLENVVAIVPGRSPQALVLTAHLDNAGTGPGADDNASGVAALVEIAHSYATAPPTTVGALPQLIRPAHTILFVATDGGAFGGVGADRFAREHRAGVLAVVNLVAIAGRGPPRIVIAGDSARTASSGLVETAAARVSAEAGRRPVRTSTLGQLVDLGFPFSVYDQGPLAAHGLPAVTLTSAGERPPDAFDDVPDRLDATRLAQLGRAAQDLLRTLDQGVEFVQGTSSYLYLGPRFVRGWAIELVLIAALLPFVLTAVDLFARCRRRRIALAPALRSYRSRLGFWLWTGAVFELFALLGIWPGGAAVPVAPSSAAAGRWPIVGLACFVVLSAVGWFVSRERLLPRRPVTVADELAGHAAALLALSLVGLLVVATNPFALIFVLPSLHAWLWLPHVQGRRAWVRAAVVALGLLGPLLLMGSFATRYGLGLDAPWYLAELLAVHFVPLPSFVIALAWAAAASQLVAIAAGRYAPYPDEADRPKFGPMRATIRRAVLGFRARRGASETERAALRA